MNSNKQEYWEFESHFICYNFHEINKHAMFPFIAYFKHEKGFTIYKK